VDQSLSSRAPQNWDDYHYDIKITPTVPRSMNRKIFQLAVPEIGDLGGGRKVMPAYDGRASFYSSMRLKKDAFEVTVKLEDEVPSPKRPSRNFKIKIKQAAMIQTSLLADYIKRRAGDFPMVAIQALDVVLAQRPVMRFKPAGRSHFFEDDQRSLGDGLSLWYGYQQSLRLSQSGMTLNLDMTGTAFYDSGDLIRNIMKILRCDQRRLSQLRRNDFGRLNGILKGVRVVTKHGYKRRYKIHSIDSTPANRASFKTDKGRQLVADYFKENYKPLRFPNLPCIMTDPKKCLIPWELCEIIAGQRKQGALGSNQQSQMIRGMCLKPHKRKEYCDNVYRKADYRNDPNLQDFGLEVKRGMISAPARVLPPPKLFYGARKPVQPRDGAWNMKGKQFFAPKPLCSWAVINWCGGNSMKQVQYFIQSLCRALGDNGMRVFQKNPPMLQGGRDFDDQSTLVCMQKAYEAAQQNANGPIKRCQLILCVKPDDRGFHYAAIKRASDMRLGVPSQCVLQKHVNKAQAQYCSNLSLKINAKIGGTNVIATRLPKMNKPTIIFGADVTHAATDDETAPSIAAVVATVDQYASRYESCFSVQGNRVEMLTTLKNMAANLLIKFYKNTKRKPERIIFFRDGVSEGQFQATIDIELSALRLACLSLDRNYRPAITFVIVRKRHHTRLFPASGGKTDRSGNVLPGTLVETEICHPFQFDFFLCSHAGIQGTSRPTHYVVLHDENKFTVDEFQMLTYHLCFTFSRCCRSVSVVPPAYYAHLVAFRARFLSGQQKDEQRGGGGNQRKQMGSIVAHRELTQDKGMYFV